MLWARHAQSTASRLVVTAAAASSAAIVPKCWEHSEHWKNCSTNCLQDRRRTLNIIQNDSTDILVIRG